MKQYGNALRFQDAGTTAAADEQAVVLRADYARFGDRADFLRGRVQAIYRSAVKGLRARWEMGRDFAAIRDATDHGEFGVILAEEFDVGGEGMSRASVYGAMALYEQYQEFGEIAHVGLSAANLLISGNVPAAAKAEILGSKEPVSHKQARAIAAKHTAPAPAPLTLEEAIGLIWATVKAHAPVDAAARLAFLEDGAWSLADLHAGRPLADDVRERAYTRVTFELRRQLAHVTATTTTAATAATGAADLPADLNGWERRGVGARVWLFRPRDGDRPARSTATTATLDEAVAAARAIDAEDGPKSASAPAVAVAAAELVTLTLTVPAVRTLARLLDDPMVRMALGAEAGIELQTALALALGED